MIRNQVFEIAALQEATAPLTYDLEVQRRYLLPNYLSVQLLKSASTVLNPRSYVIYVNFSLS
ncbi:hypothetical protein NIES3974_15970 [Calothrix sp. NIES-3974]|nr:hypothetical protein NIES3974_15970 [Calothrix sp. NIES-3974]